MSIKELTFYGYVTSIYDNEANLVISIGLNVVMYAKHNADVLKKQGIEEDDSFEITVNEKNEAIFTKIPDRTLTLEDIESISARITKVLGDAQGIIY